MKAGYMRVGPDPTGTAVGKIRKIRCGCTNEFLYKSKLYIEGTSWDQSKVNFFLDNSFNVLLCPKCGFAMWYTS